MIGILLEVVLIALGFFLPESWLQVEARNLLMATHFPLMFLMEELRFGDSVDFTILCLPIGLILMGAVWGFLIYLVTRPVKALMSRLCVSSRQKLIFRCGFGFVCLTILSWAIVSTIPATPIPFTASPKVKSAVEGNTTFALDLYKKLKDQPGNFFSHLTASPPRWR